MFGKIPLATLGLVVGGFLTLGGFVAYFSNNATLNLIGFFYGFPLLLGGLALRASELKPVPLATTPELMVLRSQQATVTQNKIRKDITRYEYGKNVHMEEALDFLGLNPTDEQRPTIVGLRELETEGAYTLIMEFDSPLIPLEDWEKKHEKMTRYFGPGVKVVMTQPQSERIEVGLITEALANSEATPV
jgi:Protein of unknown function (DUF2854)